MSNPPPPQNYSVNYCNSNKMCTVWEVDQVEVYFVHLLNKRNATV